MHLHWEGKTQKLSISSSIIMLCFCFNFALQMLYFGRLLCGAGFGLVSSAAGVGTWYICTVFIMISLTYTNNVPLGTLRTLHENCRYSQLLFTGFNGIQHFLQLTFVFLWIYTCHQVLRIHGVQVYQVSPSNFQTSKYLYNWSSTYLCSGLNLHE
jgi:hypothetical protein